jgi:AraC-like DNA-binding protein
MFYVSGIGISVFLSLLLFSKKGSNIADKILAAWLAVVAVHLYMYYAGITGRIYDHTWLLGVHLPLPLLHGPFLYLYASAQTGHKPGWKQALHFLPAAIDYLYLAHFFIAEPEYKIHVYRNHGEGYQTYTAINLTAIIVSGIGYVVATSLLLRSHKRNILDSFSATEKINLNWITYLIYGIAAIWIMVIFGNDQLVYSTAVLFVLFIGYFGSRQAGIFTAIPAIPEPPVTVSLQPEEATEPGEEAGEPARKYARSGLSPGVARQIHSCLNTHMAAERSFTLSNLTLTELATKLNVHPNHLSQAINDVEGKSFYDYINTLRVEEFKKIIVNGDLEKFTLLSLAMDCGFNSKSTFNKYFRKVTGITPSEYLARARQQSQSNR